MEMMKIERRRTRRNPQHGYQKNSLKSLQRLKHSKTTSWTSILVWKEPYELPEGSPPPQPIQIHFSEVNNVCTCNQPPTRSLLFVFSFLYCRSPCPRKEKKTLCPRWQRDQFSLHQHPYNDFHPCAHIIRHCRFLNLHHCFVTVIRIMVIIIVSYTLVDSVSGEC